MRDALALAVLAGLGLQLCVDLLTASHAVHPWAHPAPLTAPQRELLAQLAGGVQLAAAGEGAPARRSAPLPHERRAPLEPDRHAAEPPPPPPRPPPPPQPAAAGSDGGPVLITAERLDPGREEDGRLRLRRPGADGAATEETLAMWHAQWSEQLRRADAAARAAPYISSLSVIVPVFNMQDTIGSALASIEASVASLGGMLARSEVHRAHGVPVTCEVIVLDDASTDSTQQEVAEFISPALMPDLPASVRLEYTLLVATANSGQAAGRNAAARRAKGDVLLFLDADDVFRPEHLGLGYKSLSTNATVAWARTGLVVPDSVLPEWKEVRRSPFPQLPFPPALWSTLAPHTQPVHV